MGRLAERFRREVVALDTRVRFSYLPPKWASGVSGSIDGLHPSGAASSAALSTKFREAGVAGARAGLKPQRFPFDSEASHQIGEWCKGWHPCLGHTWWGFNSPFPDQFLFDNCDTFGILHLRGSSVGQYVRLITSRRRRTSDPRNQTFPMRLRLSSSALRLLSLSRLSY